MTWYSCDKHTKNKNDYILTERFVQQYITACKSEPDIDFDSDHKILIAEINTPKTCRARWTEKKPQPNPKVDVAMLRDSHARNKFNKKLDDILRTKTLTKNTTEGTSYAMVRTRKEVAESTLPKVQK